MHQIRFRPAPKNPTTASHTHTHNRFTALWILSATTHVTWYQKKHSPTNTYCGHQSSLICLNPSTMMHGILPVQSMSFTTISLQVFFGVPLGLAPSTSYFIHFFNESLSSFHNTCPYHCNLFRCSTELMSPSLSLNPLLVVSCHTSIYHSHLCPLKCHPVLWNTTFHNSII